MGKHKAKNKNIQDKVPIIGAICLIVTIVLGVALSIIHAIGLNIDNDIWIISLILLVAILILSGFILPIVFNQESKKYGQIKGILPTKTLSTALPPVTNIQFRVIWGTSVIIGSLSIILYPFYSAEAFYKLLTLSSLMIWVGWNLINIGFYKPYFIKPIEKYSDAFKYFFISELPTILSLGSVVIGTFVYDDETPILTLYLLAFMIALIISGLTVIFERGVK